MRATVRPAGLLAAAVMTAAVMTASTIAAPARAQEVTLDARAVEVDLSGRVQVQAATSSCSSFPFGEGSACTEQAPSVDLFTRRVRLSTTVRINDFLSAKVEPDFGGLDGVSLRDAYGRLTFSDHARVQIGQFKRPFDGFNLISSTRLLTVERDVDIPGVPGLAAASLDEFVSAFDLGSYDVGAMLSGATDGGRLAYRAGLFDGEDGSSGDDADGGVQLVGRLTYRLATGELPLSVSAAAAWSDRAVREPDDQPGTRLGSDHYGDFELFAELGAYEPGPHVQAGLIFGDNPRQTPDGAATGSDPLPASRGYAGMYAWQAVGAWRFALPGAEHLEAVEPAFRVTRAEPKTDVAGDGVWGFTPGLNVYFFGRNKLQINWDVATFAGDGTDAASSFKSQFQVHF